MIHKAKNAQRGQTVGKLKTERRYSPPQPRINRKTVEYVYGRKDGFGVIE
jgi:hypothetical protein